MEHVDGPNMAQALVATVQILNGKCFTYGPSSLPIDMKMPPVCHNCQRSILFSSNYFILHNSPLYFVTLIQKLQAESKKAVDCRQTKLKLSYTLVLHGLKTSKPNKDDHEPYTNHQFQPMNS
tara:strand:- start:267 stop:632 length:366 start_codon:yes stop_codon:yes gene_type:complete